MTRRARGEKNNAEESGDGCRNESGEKGRDEHSRDEKRSGNDRIEESDTMIIFACLITNSRVSNPSLKAWADCITIARTIVFRFTWYMSQPYVLSIIRRIADCSEVFSGSQLFFHLQ